MRWTRAVPTMAVLAALVHLTAGCGAGPSDRPHVAVDRPHAPGQTAPTPLPPALAAPEKPRTDLAWHDCAKQTFDQLAMGAPPAGVIFECADFTSPMDASGAIVGTFHTAAYRARVAQTPPDAAPLVLTSGTDRSSAATLAGLAAGPGSSLLAARPVVAVDHRGIGGSQSIDCVPDPTRRGLQNNGQFATNHDPLAALSQFSRDATVACRDFLQPYDGTFDAAHAADDLEQLRKQWQVGHLALLGTGSGGPIAIAYARKYGEHLARVVLDSSTAPGVDAVTATEQQVQGAEAAWQAYAGQCAGLGCRVADPRAVLIDLLHRADAGQLGDISSAALARAVIGFLSEPRTDLPTRLRDLDTALSGATSGNLTALENLIRTQTTALASDGQFVGRCSDIQQPPTEERVRGLQTQWATKYPVFGPAAAAGSLTCSAWPTQQPPPAPERITPPVLVLSGVADPITGSAGQAAVTGLLANAGARHATITWQGFGHPVSTRSDCAQQAIVRYLNSGELPGDATACPA